jgi:hypothetical protein
MLLFIALAVACFAFCLCIILFWRLVKTNRRLDVALGGSAPESLENQLAQYFTRVQDADSRLAQLADKCEKLTIISSLASQKISIVRFNPFGDTGGDQSFCLAVLDTYNSGYVLTSIHGRQGTRVYVKPVDYGKSKYNLSEEEKTAISQAAKRTPKFKD